MRNSKNTSLIFKQILFLGAFLLLISSFNARAFGLQSKQQDKNFNYKALNFQAKALLPATSKSVCVSKINLSHPQFNSQNLDYNPLNIRFINKISPARNQICYSPHLHSSGITCYYFPSEGAEPPLYS